MMRRARDPVAARPAPAEQPQAEAVPQFYRSVVDEADALLEADEIQGLDQELALLRVRLRDLGREPDHELMIKSVETIRKIVTARYRMSKQQSEDIGQALAEVFARLGAVMWGDLE